MSYLLIKQIHLTAVSLSIIGFLLRGAWMIMASPLLHKKLVRIVPHIVDTVLLVSAIAMILQIGQYPFVHGWLTAKLVALLLYILFGMVALTYGRTKPIRIAAFFAAVLSFSYIVLVALNKTPFPF